MKFTTHLDRRLPSSFTESNKRKRNEKNKMKRMRAKCAFKSRIERLLPRPHLYYLCTQ